MQYPEPIAKLIASYMKLPGIGEKTATRLAFYTIGMDDEDVQDFSKSLVAVKKDLHYCSICGNITEDDPCPICKDQGRDQSTILVVEHSRDVMAMERMNEYHGLYHVLHGTISPSEGTGPMDINIPSLIERLKKHSEVKEVIVATNASMDGETTAQYLAKLLKPAGIKVTRLAHGLSAGADIDYTDEVTLFKAVQGRTEM
ncbi:recombination mediator RecR [Limosilactobacillus coleohominis]|jgi:recombination protein RecR|uniref:Recombination protein RecR n=1 Tax=Limosilactobacillus coleohominis TaxID=181675 RepID=A0ABS2GVY0_9LACO|nr:recombination mediator RecR [Limosilactobacillus coleohominis]MCI5812046.1 recombination mediator RecR [Lactobacillus sp.]HJA22702.1 recombination mediator RecR [Candidatus Limosilactobacillus intestinavium]MBM6940442.1 recombination protein RecR [Limosilactobacillus coleohominis]MBM6955183.1 recombination protein RecR [Limosilactobacillus coleohominis]MDY3703165.1 recombination mediator RecR [Limosilactobacillus coleohominis]